jgi:hypothetical protein
MANLDDQGEILHALSEPITDLGDRLRKLRDARAALAPILGRLAGPLELRLMPVPARGANG